MSLQLTKETHSMSSSKVTKETHVCRMSFHITKQRHSICFQVTKETHSMSFHVTKETHTFLVMWHVILGD